VNVASRASAVSVLAFALGAVLAGCAGHTAREGHAGIEFLTPYGKPKRPFSPAVRVGDVLVLSGQIGVRADASGELVEGGVEAETRQTLDNIKDVLERSGSSMDRVFKCTVFLTDMREWDRMNAVYVEYFPDRKPARSAVGVDALALGARVEIECWATTGDG
jgi:reactive intermediate/imine deaminase